MCFSEIVTQISVCVIPCSILGDFNRLLTYDVFFLLIHVCSTLAAVLKSLRTLVQFLRRRYWIQFHLVEVPSIIFGEHGQFTFVGLFCNNGSKILFKRVACILNFQRWPPSLLTEFTVFFFHLSF